MKEQLKDARAEQKADAATYASSLNAQQVFIRDTPLHPLIIARSTHGWRVMSGMRVLCAGLIGRRC